MNMYARKLSYADANGWPQDKVSEDKPRPILQHSSETKTYTEGSMCYSKLVGGLAPSHKWKLRNAIVNEKLHVVHEVRCCYYSYPARLVIPSMSLCAIPSMSMHSRALAILHKPNPTPTYSPPHA